MINPWIYFWIFLKGSLFTTGGLANLPILYDDLLARGWADERQFAEALAVGQVSPGPSGLWVISLGYLTDGVRGSLLALVAISLPPLTVLAIHRLHRAIGNHPAVHGFTSGLSLASVGIFPVVMFAILRDTGLNPSSLLIVVASLALGAWQRLPVVVILLLAGVSGALVLR